MAEEIGYVEDTTPITNIIAIFGVVGTILLAIIMVLLYARR